MNNSLVKQILFITAAAVIFSIPASAKSGKIKSSEVLVTYNGGRITYEEFMKCYYIQNRIIFYMTDTEIDAASADPEMKDNPFLNKTSYIDNLIFVKISAAHALKDKSLDKKEMNAFADIWVIQAVVNFYTFEKFKKLISITEAEIREFYDANKELLSRFPFDNNLKKKIRQQMLMQKLNSKLMEYSSALLSEQKIDRSGFAKYMGNKDMSPSDTIVKIGSDRITLKEFINYYYIINKMILNKEKDEIDRMADEAPEDMPPSLNKQQLIEQMISLKVMYSAALKDKSINQNDLETVTELNRLNAISNYYLSNTIKKTIKITDDELEETYKNLKDSFSNSESYSEDEKKLKVKEFLLQNKFTESAMYYKKFLFIEYKVNTSGFDKYMKAE